MAPLDPGIRSRLEASFDRLGSRPAVDAIPRPQSLAKALGDIAPVSGSGNVHANDALVDLFTTGAVEIWLRSVHSFLLSTSSAPYSPVWASVSGYYASHYAVRSCAHLLGFFHMFRRRCNATLKKQGNRTICEFQQKTRADREHKVYWKVVKDCPLFAGDLLFTSNPEGADISDVGHRDYSNYVDHLGQFHRTLQYDINGTRDLIDRISGLSFDDPPIPRRDRFPDTLNVQVVAYQRIVAFRKLVDDVVSADNRFWGVYRNPPWARDLVSFRLVEQGSSERMAS